MTPTTIRKTRSKELGPDPEKMKNALKVFTLDPRLWRWLTILDPKALEQADNALKVSTT